MKIQKASKHITSWRNSIPSPKTSFKEENTKTHEEKKMCSKRVLCALGMLSCAPGVNNSVEKPSFSAQLTEKTTYKYKFSH